ARCARRSCEPNASVKDALLADIGEVLRQDTFRDCETLASKFAAEVPKKLEGAVVRLDLPIKRWRVAGEIPELQYGCFHGQHAEITEVHHGPECHRFGVFRVKVERCLCVTARVLQEILRLAH